jgi:hypothetical protein
MSIFHNNSLIGASGSGGGAYSISRSLRFNSTDSAYLSRTPASAGNRRTWTWAGWVKRAKLSEETAILSARTDINTRLFCGFDSTTNSLQIYANLGAINVVTAGSFRDLSAWYHIVFSFDTTQATSSNRVKIFVNGIQQTLSGIFPNQNTDFDVNNTVQHTMGSTGPAVSPANLYLAESYLIDGQALDPTSFGEFDTNGIWQPKRYAGTYGTNGFKLDFADNSSNTATTLGKDTSGNGNNWTPNNLSVTAGAGNDSLVDVPTNGVQPDTGVGGEVRGNYCTWNAAGPGASSLTQGNLRLTTNSNAVLGTIGTSSGKWYYEGILTAQVNDQQMFGVVNENYRELIGQIGDSPYGWAIIVQSNVSNGQPFSNSSTGSTLTSYANGDIVQVAYDCNAGKIWFGKNGTWLGSGDPANGLNAVFSNLSGVLRPGATNRLTSGGVIEVNYGARPFAYTAPSGFKALCTANLPAPVITKPNTVFDVKLWTGNGTSQTISGLGFSPDFVWTKGRSTSTNHNQVDTLRGANKYLFSNGTVAEITNNDALTSFTSDGFTVGSDIYINGNGTTFVGWCWDAGSSTVTNTAGSITSSVRANASAGFSIVTYTGAQNVTVGHGLGVTPSLIIAKSRTYGDQPWVIYHTTIGKNGGLRFDTTTGFSITDYWGSLGPTSTTFGTANVSNPANGYGNMVAYCFAPVVGYSSFGSYTGNGSTDGPFVYTGFRSRWILIKNASASESWIVFDTARNTYNVVDNYLYANEASAENRYGALGLIDILSNGFKFRRTELNASGNTFVYAAFAESPFQYARAR